MTEISLAFLDDSNNYKACMKSLDKNINRDLSMYNGVSTADVVKRERLRQIKPGVNDKVQEAFTQSILFVNKKTDKEENAPADNSDINR